MFKELSLRHNIKFNKKKNKKCFSYRLKTINKKRLPGMLILKVIALMHQNHQKTRKKNQIRNIF